jgi:serine phosphatase RsbU (regulator of sigma subunit)
MFSGLTEPYPTRSAGFFARYNSGQCKGEHAMGRAEMELALPGREPWRPELGQANGLDLDAQCSSERTGGDLFDAVRVGPRVAFLLSDIAGRRPELDPIAAAMREAFRASSAELFRGAGANLMEGTEMLVQAVNHALIAAAKGARFAPTMVGCYDLQLGVLAYINAGGQTALIRDAEGTRALPNVSVPLGLFTHFSYDASMQAFEPGAMLLVVTKGVTESMGGKSPSDPERVVEVLRNSKDQSASTVCGAVLKAAQGSEKRRWGWLPFRGNRMREDMTALAMVRMPQTD